MKRFRSANDLVTIFQVVVLIGLFLIFGIVPIIRGIPAKRACDKRGGVLVRSAFPTYSYTCVVPQ